MQKTTNITIGGVLFHLEEDAYQKLSVYLDEIKAYFEDTDGADEIVADIETRIAERMMAERGESRKVITLMQVETITRQLGSVEDFESFDVSESSEKRGGVASLKNARQKLFRDPEDSYLGGVCSGIAHFFGVGPVLVRVLFILAFLFYGAGVIVYLILWVILPSANTPERQKQMYGGDFGTIRAIKRKAESSRAKMEKKSGKFMKGIMRLFHFGERSAKALIRAGFIIAGALILLGAFGIAVVGTFFTALYAFGMFPWYINFPIAEMAYGTASYYVVLVSGFLAFLIPLLIAMAIGWFFIGRKFIVGKKEVLSLVGVWIIAVVVGIGVFAQASAPYIEKLAPEEGEVVTRDISVKDFNAVYLYAGDAFKSVTIVPIPEGEETTVTMRAAEGVFERLSVSVGGNALEIGPGEGTEAAICIFCKSWFYDLPNDATLTIRTPDLREIWIQGGQQQDVKIGDFDLERLSATIFSESNWNVAASAEHVNLEVYGESRVTYTAPIDELELDLNRGSVFLATTTPPIQKANVMLSDNSTAKIRVSEKITGYAYDGSKLIYFGTPKVDVEKFREGKYEECYENFGTDANIACEEAKVESDVIVKQGKLEK